MAMPALEFKSETPVEERLGKLETHVEHMQSDISDLKINVKRLDDKVDSLKDEMREGFAAVERRFAALEERLAEKFSAIDKQFLKMQIARIADRVWFLLTAAVLLGVLARGFKWL